MTPRLCLRQLASRLRQLASAIAHRCSDRSCDLFVIADPADSTISLSPALSAHIARACGDRAALLIMFSVPRLGTYGFAPASHDHQSAQLAALDFDPALRCWGFAAICPTVAQMFARWNLPPLDTQCLRVIYRRRGPTPFYQLCPP